MHGLGDTLLQKDAPVAGRVRCCDRVLPETFKKMINNNIRLLKFNSEKVWGGMIMSDV